MPTSLLSSRLYLSTTWLILPALVCLAGAVQGKQLPSTDSLWNGEVPARERFLAVSDSLLRVNPDSAFGYTLQYLLFAKNESSALQEAYGRYQLGRCYFESGHYELASDSFTEAMTVFKVYEDKNGEALVLKSLGYILYNIGNRAGALDYYKRALQLKDSLVNANDISELYNRMGVVYASLDSVGRSKDYFDKALLLGEYRNDTVEIARTLNNIGFAMNMMGRPDEALNYLKEALLLKTASRAGRASLCPTLNNMARAFLQAQQYDSALAYSRHSLAIAEELRLVLRRKEAHELLREIYSTTRDFERAFHHQKQFYELSNSILNNNNSRLVKNLIAQYQYDLGQKDSRINMSELVEANEPVVLGVMLAFVLSMLILAWSYDKRFPALYHFAYLLFIVLLIEWLATLAKRQLIQMGILEVWSSLFSFLVIATLVLVLQKYLRSYLERT